MMASFNIMKRNFTEICAGFKIKLFAIVIVY